VKQLYATGAWSSTDGGPITFPKPRPPKIVCDLEETLYPVSIERSPSHCKKRRTGCRCLLSPGSTAMPSRYEVQVAGLLRSELVFTYFADTVD